MTRPIGFSLPMLCIIVPISLATTFASAIYNRISGKPKEFPMPPTNKTPEPK